MAEDPKDSETPPDWSALFQLVYAELHRLAHRIGGGHPHRTLDTKALVNEVWLHFAESPPFRATSADEFKRIAARAMQDIVVESIRRRRAQKRGGSERPVTFDEELHLGTASDEQVLALVELLAQLAALDARQAEIVRLKFFGGLTDQEAANVLGISVRTVERDWSVARAWLKVELGRLQG